MKRHIVHVFNYELRRNARRKGYLFATFGLPLIALVLLFGYQFITNLDLGRSDPVGQADDGFDRAGYVDHSGLFPQPGSLADLLARYDDEDAARAALEAGDIDVYYVIAADYLDSGEVTLTMPSLSFNAVESFLITDLVFDVLVADSLAPGADPNLVRRLRRPALVEEINLSRSVPEGVATDEDSTFALVYVFTLIFLMSILMTNGYLMQSVIEEKENRLVEILLSSLRPVELLSGKILAMAALGLAQIVVWLAAVGLILRLTEAFEPGLEIIDNLYLPADVLPLMLVYFVLAYLLLAGAFSGIGALSGSMREGPQFSAVITLPMVAPLWGISIFVRTPDAPLLTALSLFPLTAPLSMVMRLVLTTPPPWQIGLSLLLLTAAVLGMMWLAGRLFRVHTLLAGGRPHLRDIPRLLAG